MLQVGVVEIENSSLYSYCVVLLNQPEEGAICICATFVRVKIRVNFQYKKSSFLFLYLFSGASSSSLFILLYCFFLCCCGSVLCVFIWLGTSSSEKLT